MTIQIQNIKESRNVFDVNKIDRIFFNMVNGKSVRMAKEEQANFLACNFVVGYAGKDFRLASWSQKMSKGLHNINVDMNVSDLRQYLWHLVNCEFSAIEDNSRRI